MTEEAAKPTREHLERLSGLDVGDVLTTEDAEAIKFVLQTAASLYEDNTTFYNALKDIRDERNQINGKGRMARRAAQALGDRA